MVRGQDHIDVQALAIIAKKHLLKIYVEVLPGSFVHEGELIARFLPAENAQAKDQEYDTDIFLSAVTIGARRTFDHDPRFGLSVLSEIASRALSPSVNDPGTAIDVIGRGIRTFNAWARPPHPASLDIACPNVYIRELSLSDMYDDFFSPIARDGAALLEVNIRLVKALTSLTHTNPGLFGDLSAQHISVIIKRADISLALEEDKSRLNACALQVTDV